MGEEKQIKASISTWGIIWYVFGSLVLNLWLSEPGRAISSGSWTAVTTDSFGTGEVVWPDRHKKNSSVGSGFGFTITQPVTVPKYQFLPGEEKVPTSQVCLQELPLNLCKAMGHLHLHLNWDAFTWLERDKLQLNTGPSNSELLYFWCAALIRSGIRTSLKCHGRSPRQVLGLLQGNTALPGEWGTSSGCCQCFLLHHHARADITLLLIYCLPSLLLPHFPALLPPIKQELKNGRQRQQGLWSFFSREQKSHLQRNACYSHTCSLITAILQRGTCCNWMAPKCQHSFIIFNICLPSVNQHIRIKSNT